MNRILMACALMCASSSALADAPVQFVCGGGDELSVSFPENQDDSHIAVNGIQYDYANSYSVRRDPNFVMYQFSHNDHSVFMVIDPVTQAVSINYQGRNELCEKGTPYDN